MGAAANVLDLVDKKPALDRSVLAPRQLLLDDLPEEVRESFERVQAGTLNEPVARQQADVLHCGEVAAVDVALINDFGDAYGVKFISVSVSSLQQDLPTESRHVVGVVCRLDDDESIGESLDFDATSGSARKRDGRSREIGHLCV